MLGFGVLGQADMD